MTRVRRLLREPLVHFVAIGGLIFVLYEAISAPAPAPAETIVVAPERIEQLAKAYQAVWQRPPDDDELSAIVDDFVREEIYYREALALGLDRGDTVVRRRLRQKMEFLTDAGAQMLAPSTGELEAYLLAHERSFQRAPRLAFEQVFLGPDPAPEKTRRVLRALQSEPSLDVSSVGERTMLPARSRLSPPRDVDGTFGAGFFERLAAVPAGVWAGPVVSAFGVHLVRVGERLAARTPPLEAIRESVLRDWKSTKAGELREAHYARLRERYVVDIRRGETGATREP